MGKNQTEKCPYPSKYSPGTYVTPAQYLNELVCEKKAVYDKTILPIKFWNLRQWKMYFMKNLRQVSKFLEYFDVEAVANALKAPRFFNRYSIFTEHFAELVQEEQVKIDNIKAKKSEHQIVINRATIDNKPRAKRPQQNLLDKLDDI